MGGHSFSSASLINKVRTTEGNNPEMKAWREKETLRTKQQEINYVDER